MTDKCLCINSYYTPTVNTIVFEKGKIYDFTDQKFVTREYPEGYNVCFFNGEYIYFRKYQDPLAETGYGLFSTHFKPILEIRKEKINKIKERINEM